MTLDPVHDILPGLPVFTEDGVEVGRVKEIAPNRIKIDVSLQPDFWVSRDHVLSYTAERVTLDIPGGEVETVKLREVS